MVSVAIMYCVEQMYLVGGHNKGVNVTLLRGVTICETKLRGNQQFRSYVTVNAWLGCCSTAWFRDGRIGDDTRDPEVP